MKLAEALIRRSDLQKRLDQLGERLRLSAKVQEGSNPPEDPLALLGELNDVTTELTKLVEQVNITNSRVVLDGQTLTAMLAHREQLAKKITILRGVVAESSKPMPMITRSELRTVSTIKISDLRSTIDSLSKEHRELDTKIQGANWNTELLS